MTAVTLACPVCEAPLRSDDRFCEACGARVGEAPAEQTHSRPEDRSEADLGIAAGVTDRGLVHRRNEDALQLEAVDDGRVVGVVCDGISTSTAADVAARHAADAARRVLADALRNQSRPLTDATTRAIAAARRAVLGVPSAARPGLDVPSCTLVSGVARDGDLTVGWVGDSRAYWIADANSHQLTVDDSWATEQVAAGLRSAEEAFADTRAHAITRWLGADAPSDLPHVITERPAQSGRLVLCSDGLWNYAPGAADIRRLLDVLPPDASPLAVARRLTDAALARGGRDNITVAVVDVRQAAGAGT